MLVICRTNVVRAVSAVSGFYAWLPTLIFMYGQGPDYVYQLNSHGILTIYSRAAVSHCESAEAL